MTFSVSLVRSALLLLAGLVFSGCLPPAQSQLEEEKEPHFLRGKSRVSELDYRGAIESFEKALEINPQSASAHFELGCLFENKQVADPAAAIYHYEQYLKLRPKADNAEIVRQQVMACKQELARAVWVGPISERVQREIEQLTQDNKRLTEEQKRAREDLEKWRAYALHLQTLTNPPAAPVRAAGSGAFAADPGTASGLPRPVGTLGPAEGGAPAPDPLRPVNLVRSAARTHVVQPGETLTVIARKYGLKLQTLQAANPRLEPRRMRAGQTLTIPAS